MTKEDLGTYLNLELGMEASTYGFTIALEEAVLNLVLLTPWVRWLDNPTLFVNCQTLHPS